MAINLDAVGRTFGPFSMACTPRDVMLYALAVGADDTELQVRGIYDKGSGALVDMHCRTSVGGEALCENDVSFFVVGEGGFGGERGPKAEKIEPPARPADHRVEMKTSSTQGILYRLTLYDPAMAEAAARGFRDPHIDPEGAARAGFERPLLHGLCTLGYLTRAVLRAVTGSDPSGIRGVRARFAAPVHAGEVLVTELWRDGDRLVAQMKNAAGTVVLSDAAVDLV
jgi:acyl dehydratase